MNKIISVIDGHCDTLLDIAEGKRNLKRESNEGHLDLPRMKKGGVKVQFFAAFIESVNKPERALKRCLQLIETYHKVIEGCSPEIIRAYNFNDIKWSMKHNKIAAVLSIEGGEALAGDLNILNILFRLGVRSIGLTWNQRNEIADGIGESCTGGGLTNFGREVIKEMNKIKMIIDLAHIAEKGFWDVLNETRSPVMVSHANCYAICSHPRNLKDEQIKALADNEGILGLTFVPDFISEKSPSLDSFLKHVDHAVEMAGIDHVGLGSDFDGIEKTPYGLEDATKYPALAEALEKRGYKSEDIEKIFYLNFLRFLEKVMP